MAKRAVVLLSGGMDSAVLLHWALNEGFQVQALSVNYGQRHERELQSAVALAEVTGVHLTQLDLGIPLQPIFEGSRSSQVNLDVDVPYGHYAAENMKTTIVPNRNMLLIALAGALAEASREPDERVVIMYAAHAGDHAIYPDCRPEFFGSCRTTINFATDNWVTLMAPLGNKTKADIAKLGMELDVPFELTYSCYEGGDLHCGKCGTCVERKEAFQLAGVTDPTEYKTDEAPFAGAD